MTLRVAVPLVPTQTSLATAHTAILCSADTLGQGSAAAGGALPASDAAAAGGVRCAGGHDAVATAAALWRCRGGCALPGGVPVASAADAQSREQSAAALSTGTLCGRSLRGCFGQLCLGCRNKVCAILQHVQGSEESAALEASTFSCYPICASAKAGGGRNSQKRPSHRAGLWRWSPLCVLFLAEFSCWANMVAATRIVAVPPNMLRVWKKCSANAHS